MTRVCRKCSAQKPLEEFSRTSKTKLGRRSICKCCEQLYYQANREQRVTKACEWQKRNASRVRNNGLKRHYGLTLTDYESLLLAQDSKCAMCRTDKPGGKGVFHVDHCHKTGKVRSLLCHHCNVGLGHLGDDPARASEMLYRYASLVSQEQVIDEGY